MDLPADFRRHSRDLGTLRHWTQQCTEAALEPDQPIFDAHHHLWDDDRGRYLVNELIEDIETGHRIVGTLYVEAGAMYRSSGPAELRPVGEVEFANRMVLMSTSERFSKTQVCAGIVGHADLSLGEQVRPVLEALSTAGNGRLRGIRQSTAWNTGNPRPGKREVRPHLMFSPTFRQGFGQLRSLGLCFDASLFHPQLPELEDLLHSFPESQVILNHLGVPLGIPPYAGKRDEVLREWRGHVQHLAKFPNLSVKVSGLGMLYCGFDFHRRKLPPSSEKLANAWRPYVETAIDIFGADRCMLASNFPVDKQSCGYGVLWNAFKRLTRGYSVDERRALYQGTAARVYGLPI